MKKILIIVLLAGILSANPTCNMYVKETKKSLEGMQISAGDGDMRGYLESKRAFMLWSKRAIIECTNGMEVTIKGIRQRISKDGLK